MGNIEKIRDILFLVNVDLQNGEWENNGIVCSCMCLQCDGNVTIESENEEVVVRNPECLGGKKCLREEVEKRIREYPKT